MKYLIGLAALAVILLFAGCKSFEQKVADVQERLAVIEKKGLPDSVITPIRLSLATAQSDKGRKRSGDANKNIKKAITAVKSAEDFLEKSLTEKKPEVISRRNALAEKVDKDFRGLHKKEADSLIALADSFINIDFYFKAEHVILHLEREYDKLKKAQALADSIRPKIAGTWSYIDTIRHSEDKNVNAIEKKIFVLNKNGTGKFTAEKKGQSGPFMKEDWKFERFGTWDVKGGVLYLTTSRYIGHEQKTWQLNEITGKWGHMTKEGFVEGKPFVVAREVLEADHKDIHKENINIPFRDLENEYKHSK